MRYNKEDKIAQQHGCVDVAIETIEDGHIVKIVTRNYPVHLKIPAIVIKKVDMGPVPQSQDKEHDI